MIIEWFGKRRRAKKHEEWIHNLRLGFASYWRNRYGRGDLRFDNDLLKAYTEEWKVYMIALGLNENTSAFDD